MGEFVLPAGGTAWTQSLIAVMEALGFQNKATRQALARMEKREWLKRDRVGRRTRWIVTDSFARLLEDGAERIYGFGSSLRQWDERWLVLAVSVPERDRKLRYRLGQGLSWAGFGSLGQGLWISPWVDQETLAVDLLGQLDVDAVSFRSELGEIGSGPALAQQAWDLPELRRRYDDFLDLANDLDREIDGGAEAAAHLGAIVHRWRRFPFLDPDLPTALLPDDWPGPAAAARFTEVRSRLAPAARQWWDVCDNTST